MCCGISSSWDVKSSHIRSMICIRILVTITMTFGDNIVGVPARYVRQSQLCPQLDVSDKNDKKTQDMSDRARYVRQKL